MRSKAKKHTHKSIKKSDFQIKMHTCLLFNHKICHMTLAHRATCCQIASLSDIFCCQWQGNGCLGETPKMSCLPSKTMKIIVGNIHCFSTIISLFLTSSIIFTDVLVLRVILFRNFYCNYSVPTFSANLVLAPFHFLFGTYTKMNAPPTFESFLLFEGEKKYVVIKPYDLF